mmetsp:Transcript_2156/g.6591  ORF Transcript_2156/g.6591 Transcript_2156/m.6591 type:complete len:257 (-) Transcript_2156:121-891(-)
MATAARCARAMPVAASTNATARTGALSARLATRRSHSVGTSDGGTISSASANETRREDALDAFDAGVVGARYSSMEVGDAFSVRGDASTSIFSAKGETSVISVSARGDASVFSAKGDASVSANDAAMSPSKHSAGGGVGGAFSSDGGGDMANIGDANAAGSGGVASGDSTSLTSCFLTNSGDDSGVASGVASGDASGDAQFLASGESRVGRSQRVVLAGASGVESYASSPRFCGARARRRRRIADVGAIFARLFDG